MLCKFNLGGFNDINYPSIVAYISGIKVVLRSCSVLPSTAQRCDVIRGLGEVYARCF